MFLLLLKHITYFVNVIVLIIYNIFVFAKLLCFCFGELPFCLLLFYHQRQRPSCRKSKLAVQCLTCTTVHSPIANRMTKQHAAIQALWRSPHIILHCMTSYMQYTKTCCSTVSVFSMSRRELTIGISYGERTNPFATVERARVCEVGASAIERVAIVVAADKLTGALAVEIAISLQMRRGHTWNSSLMITSDFLCVDFMNSWRSNLFFSHTYLLHS